jgi:drug/metabolite transporter (DMT)-like permease
MPRSAALARRDEQSMHKTTGRWQFGLVLTLITVFMWGSLPIPLKILVGVVDAVTITWFRFLVASVLLGAWLALRGGLPSLRNLSRTELVLLGISVVGLAGNYILYLLGLEHITPGAAQVVIQLAPMFLLLGGLAVFRERYSLVQWLGFAILCAGLVLYFHNRLSEMFDAHASYGAGVITVVVAGVMWAAYAMTQKQLLKTMRSEAIMFCIYAASVILFLPATHPTHLARLDGVQVGLLVYACLNTIIAYGCFAEALDHWEASRVSAVLAITPLLTLVFVAWVAKVTPGVLPPEGLDALSIAGACIVVVGSALSALAPRERVVTAAPAEVPAEATGDD